MRYGYYNLSTMSSVKALLEILYPELKFSMNRDLKKNFQQAIKTLAIKSVENVENFDEKLEKLTNDRIFFASTYDLKLILYVNREYIDSHKEQLLSYLNPIFYKELDNKDSQKIKLKERGFYINDFLFYLINCTAYSPISLQKYGSTVINYHNIVSDRYSGVTNHLSLIGDSNPNLEEHINRNYYRRKSIIKVNSFFEESFKNKVDFYQVIFEIRKKTNNNIRGAQREKLKQCRPSKINLTAHEIKEYIDDELDINYDAVAELINDIYESEYETEQNVL